MITICRWNGPIGAKRSVTRTNKIIIYRNGREGKHRLFNVIKAYDVGEQMLDFSEQAFCLFVNDSMPVTSGCLLKEAILPVELVLYNAVWIPCGRQQETILVTESVSQATTTFSRTIDVIVVG